MTESEPDSTERQGPFWDVIAGRAEQPPAATTLGWELLSVDPERGEIEVGFTATEGFLNPAGTVQGGFLAAMLDDTMGPALVATLGRGEFAPTLDLQVQFMRPGPVGRYVGSGRVVSRGGTIAFLSGELHTAEGELVATATATARIIRT